jgi:hypothetical protein
MQLIIAEFAHKLIPRKVCNILNGRIGLEKRSTIGIQILVVNQFYKLIVNYSLKIADTKAASPAREKIALARNYPTGSEILGLIPSGFSSATLTAANGVKHSDWPKPSLHYDLSDVPPIIFRKFLMMDQFVSGKKSRAEVLVVLSLRVFLYASATLTRDIRLCLRVELPVKGRIFRFAF